MDPLRTKHLEESIVPDDVWSLLKNKPMFPHPSIGYHAYNLKACEC